MSGKKRFEGEKIYKAIPNRYPLMFLDTLVVEAGVKATGYMELSPDTWFFQCHFPDMPVMPATLLVETMTQVFISTFLPEQDCSHSVDKWAGEDIPLLIHVSGFKMKLALHPNDAVRIDAHLYSFKRGIARGKCEAFKLPACDTDTETLVTEFEVAHALPSAMAVPELRGKKEHI